MSLLKSLPALLLVSFAACAAEPVVIESIDPEIGPVAGGTRVLVIGDGFFDEVEVRFGDEVGLDVEILSRNVLRVTTPPSEAGLVDVTATRDYVEGTLDDGFTYVDAPVVTRVTPGWGSTDGGTMVTVEGNGFDPGAVVRFGGGVGVGAMVLDERTVAVVTPAGPIGPVDVTVENPDGQAGTLIDGFEYRFTPACRIVSTDPAHGQEDVSIVDSIDVRWSTPVALGSSSFFELRGIGGEVVPVDVEPMGADAVRISPRRNLQLWSTYVLSSAGLRSDEGSICEPAALAFATVVPEVLPRPLQPTAASSMVVMGDVLFAADDLGGALQVYDLSSGIPDLLTEHPLDEAPRALTLSANRLYVSGGSYGVGVYDVSDPMSLVRLGRIRTPGSANDVVPIPFASGKYIAVADGLEGVHILEVSDPERAIPVARIDASGSRDASSQGIWLASSGLLAVADGSRGVVLADISDPTAPRILATGDDPDGGAEDVVMIGDVIYAAYGGRGVKSFVRAGASLVLVAESDAPSPTEEYSTAVYAGDGTTLYVAAGRAGVLEYRVDGAGSLTRVGSFPTEGPALAVTMHDRQLIAGEESGVHRFDPSGSTEPALTPGGHGTAWDVWVQGHHAFVAAGSKGLRVFDLTDPESPVLVASVPTPGSTSTDVGPTSVITTSDLAIVGDGRAGLATFDIRNPEDPSRLASLPTRDRVGEMVLVGDIVYACVGNRGAVLVDLSDPADPVELASESFPPELGVFGDNCRDVLVHDDTLILGSNEALTLIDVSDPRNPRTRTRAILRSGDTINALELVDDFLYVATAVSEFESPPESSNRIKVFRLSALPTLERVWVTEDLGGAVEMVVSADMLVVAAKGKGFGLLSLARPDRPTLLGFADGIAAPRGVFAGPEAIYGAQRTGGLAVLHTGRLVP